MSSLRFTAPNASRDRRAFLRFLAASPLMAYAGFNSEWANDILGLPLAAQENEVIKSVKEAVNVFDFEKAARAKMQPPHYLVVTGGVFDDSTNRADREGFSKYGIRQRRLTGFGGVDQSVDIFGVKRESPIFLCTGMAQMSHPEGNVAVARAARVSRSLQTFGATEPAVVKTRGEAVWHTTQGMPPQPALIQKLEAAGCPVLIWNVDHGGGGNQTSARAMRLAGIPNLDQTSTRPCNTCHMSPQYPRNRVNLDDPLDKVIGGIGSLRENPAERNMTWDDVKRAKDQMKNMKLVLKGILSGEDAALAVANGADGILVSTHGGHNDQAGRGAIECLPEVVAGAARRIPVFVDSGFRTGADVYKALALGATAVGIARPWHWGLASFQEEGIAAVVTILRRELQVVMAQTGSSSIAKINPASLVARR